MTCKFAKFKSLQNRMRRTMHYGRGDLNSLTEPLSRMVVEYFESRRNDFPAKSSTPPLDMEFLAAFSASRCVNPCTLLVALIYVNRVQDLHDVHASSAKNSVLTSRHQNNSSGNENASPLELFLSAIVLATKFLNDGGLNEFVWNDEFASVSNIDIAKVNRLELQMLDRLEWNLLVDENTFGYAFGEAERWIARASLHRRGFLTYNEINAFVTDLNQFLPYARRFVGACAALIGAYACTIALFMAGLSALPKNTRLHYQSFDDLSYSDSNSSADKSLSNYNSNWAQFPSDSMEFLSDSPAAGNCIASHFTSFPFPPFFPPFSFSYQKPSRSHKTVDNTTPSIPPLTYSIQQWPPDFAVAAGFGTILPVS